MLLTLTIIVLVGCAPTYPMTTGFHAAPSDRTLKPRHVLVWSNDPAVESMLKRWVQQQGRQVIDVARVAEVAQAQPIPLSPGPDLERTLLTIAQRLNADHVLLGAVTLNSHPVYWMYSGHKEGGDRVNTLYDPTVTVRSLTVHTRTVRWSVTASSPTEVFTPTQTIRELTETVLQRGACEAEPDHEWKDGRGCREKP